MGAYTISYNDGEKDYYFRDNVNLPGAGCFASKAYTEKSYIKLADMFDYNTADENKHFYVIASESFIKINCSSDPTDVVVKVRPAELHDGEGISIGDAGTFEENGDTYYYWEIKVDESFQHNSDSVKYVVEIYNNKKDYNLWGRLLDIRGYVKYGDVDGNENVDFADVLYLKRYLANWNKYNLTKKVISDLNADGKIDNADVMILERHIAGWSGYATLPKVS